MKHLFIALLVIPSLLFSQEMPSLILTTQDWDTVSTDLLPRKSRRKPIVAAITGTLAAGFIIAGYVYKSKATEFLDESRDIYEDYMMSTDPDEHEKFKNAYYEKRDDAHRMNTYRKRCFTFGGVFIIAFTFNLVIPSRDIQ